MPKIEVMNMSEEEAATEKKERDDAWNARMTKGKEEPITVNPVADAIIPRVDILPVGTNIRQIRLTFEVKTNKVDAKDITDIVNSVVRRSIPLIGEKLVEVINVEKGLLDATR